MVRKTLLFALLASLPATAHSAVTVLGNSEARECYEAARDEQATAGTIRLCTRALSQGLLVGRDRVATHVNRGILYVQRGDMASGLADYDRALALDAEEPEAYLNKGLALLRRDNSGASALPMFNAAIEYGTSEPAIAYYARAVAHEFNGDIPAAYHDLRRAQELDPEWDAPARDLQRFVVQE